jgi:hypothetical protein
MYLLDFPSLQLSPRSCLAGRESRNPLAARMLLGQPSLTKWLGGWGEEFLIKIALNATFRGSRLRNATERFYHKPPLPGLSSTALAFS